MRALPLVFFIFSFLLLFTSCAVPTSQTQADVDETIEEQDNSSETQEIIEEEIPEESEEERSEEETEEERFPLGDGKYSSNAKKGFVFSCESSFHGGGAFQDGPWIQGDYWIPSAKDVHVSGSVDWPNAIFTLSLQGDERIISANNLPINHNTGVYPVQKDDEAYKYDRNPHSIEEQDLAISLPAVPELAAEASCLGRGVIGIMLSGVPLYNALDEMGRDAVAHEIQDSCEGHPQEEGQYHYHSESDCFEDDEQGHSALLGYALDGFGIYGKYGDGGVLLHTEDLDVCHGHSHEILWDGEVREIYHYHFTDDYPYSLGCFMGEPVSL